MAHKIIDKNKQVYITFDYPPFVDGSYEDLRNLVGHLRVSSGVKNQSIFNDAYAYIDKLEDQEKHPIKYIKRFLRFYFLLELNELKKYDDKTEYSEEEVNAVKNMVEKKLVDEKIDLVMKCPFPYSKKTILDKKKDILNIVYARIESEKLGPNKILGVHV